MNPVIPNVQRIIRERGLKQKTIGEKIGLNPQAFSSLMRDRKTVTAEIIIQLCKALDVDANELFRDTG